MEMICVLPRKSAQGEFEENRVIEIVNKRDLMSEIKRAQRIKQAGKYVCRFFVCQILTRA